MRIPIVMVSDDNFISQIRVAIWSMRKSTCKEAFLEITILCLKELGESSRKRLQELEAVFLNLSIRFYEVDFQIFSRARPMGHVPVASFYRLVIADVMKEYEKCLFLDGDLIVNTDLCALYSQDIGEFYIAGVRDNEFLYDPDAAFGHLENYGFKDYYHYVNAGVMLFNLTKLREDHLQERFLECMKIDFPYMDQDILNKVCEGNIKLLELKYNFFSRCKTAGCYSASDKKKINGKTWEILHFAGYDKPWQNIRVYGAQEWWECAKEALEEEVYQTMYLEAVRAVEQSDWSYILEHCAQVKEIMIIGYSRIGIDVLTSLKRSGVTAELYYCDNSIRKQRLSDENIAIYSIEELAEKHPKALWLNTSQRSYQEINRQLKGLGVEKEQIITYRHKNDAYFEMLEDDFFEYEIRQKEIKLEGAEIGRRK